MTDRANQLRADKILGVLTKDKGKAKPRKEIEFEVNGGLITLTDTQQSMMMRALEIYFPYMYIDIKYKRPHVLECEETLDQLLVQLDKEMSDNKHFELYKGTNTDEYNFLVSIRLKHMLK